MPSYNKVIIIGYLVKTPELQHSKTNAPYTRFTVAINRKRKADDGETIQDVTFVNCTAWGRNAENIAQYFCKGDPILIEGALRQHHWTTDSGEKHSAITIDAYQFAFINTKADRSDTKEQPESRRSAGTKQPPRAPIDDDDIPF